MSSLSDEEFHQQALAGGASRHYTSGNVPDRGFMVGGARNLEDQPFPEFKHPVDQFSLDHVRHHARQVRDHFGDSREVHQGAWVEDGSVVLDASERIEDKLAAKTTARQRGERAIYDLGSGKDVQTAPGAHKAGAHKK